MDRVCSLVLRLTIKKLPKSWHFFPKIWQKFSFFQQNCHWQFCRKNDNFCLKKKNNVKVLAFLTFKWQFSELLTPAQGFSKFWLDEPKCTEIWSEKIKVPFLSHLGPIWATFEPNMTSLWHRFLHTDGATIKPLDVTGVSDWTHIGSGRVQI